MLSSIKSLLKSLGYFEIDFDYEEDNSYYFEAQSDANVLIRVDVNGSKASVYDAYAGDKHFTYVETHDLK